MAGSLLGKIRLNLFGRRAVIGEIAVGNHRLRIRHTDGAVGDDGKPVHVIIHLFAKAVL